MPSHKPQKFAFTWLVSLVLLIGISTARAETVTPPDALLKQVADKMISELNTKRVDLKGDAAKVQALVEEHLLPSVDIINSSKLGLGQYWNSADE